jgi:type II secretory pathway pseudopilin PulG
MEDHRQAAALRQKLTQGYPKTATFYRVVYRLSDEILLRQAREFKPAPWPGKQHRRAQAGFGLVEIMLAAVIMLVLLAAIIPNLVRANQVGDELAASAQLAQIASAETVMAQEYGIYVPPAELTGNLSLTSPGSCSNVFLLAGQGAQNPPGYAMTWSLDSATSSSNSGCSTVTSQAKAFHINVDPQNRLAGQRHFYLDQTGVVRSNNTRAATASDPVYAVPTQVSTLLVASGPNQSNNAPTTPTPVPPGGTYNVIFSTLYADSVQNSNVANGTLTIDPVLLNTTGSNVPGCANLSGNFGTSSPNFNDPHACFLGNGFTSFQGTVVFGTNGTFTFMGNNQSSGGYGIQIVGTQQAH